MTRSRSLGWHSSSSTWARSGRLVVQGMTDSSSAAQSAGEEISRQEAVPAASPGTASVSR
ncbi:hypothetical protein ACKI1Q_40875 [Streptomyces galilaeus]|uniref:hypothetical protein n=1 Tax=Streptomyces galilaeus TaxID=33899 RepID=UPI0038F7ED6D